MKSLNVDLTEKEIKTILGILQGLGAEFEDDIAQIKEKLKGAITTDPDDNDDFGGDFNPVTPR